MKRVLTTSFALLVILSTVLAGCTAVGTPTPGAATTEAEGAAYALTRFLADEQVVTVVNVGLQAVRVEAPLAGGTAERRWGRGEARVEGGTWRAELPPRSAGAWLVR